MSNSATLQFVRKLSYRGKETVLKSVKIYHHALGMELPRMALEFAKEFAEGHPAVTDFNGNGQACELSSPFTRRDPSVMAVQFVLWLDRNGYASDHEERLHATRPQGYSLKLEDSDKAIPALDFGNWFLDVDSLTVDSDPSNEVCQ